MTVRQLKHRFDLEFYNKKFKINRLRFETQTNGSSMISHIKSFQTSSSDGRLQIVCISRPMLPCWQCPTNFRVLYYMHNVLYCKNMYKKRWYSIIKISLPIYMYTSNLITICNKILPFLINFLSHPLTLTQSSQHVFHYIYTHTCMYTHIYFFFILFPSSLSPPLLASLVSSISR